MKQFAIRDKNKNFKVPPSTKKRRYRKRRNDENDSRLLRPHAGRGPTGQHRRCWKAGPPAWSLRPANASFKYEGKTVIFRQRKAQRVREQTCATKNCPKAVPQAEGEMTPDRTLSTQIKVPEPVQVSGTWNSSTFHFLSSLVDNRLFLKRMRKTPACCCGVTARIPLVGKATGTGCEARAARAGAGERHAHASASLRETCRWTRT